MHLSCCIPQTLTAFSRLNKGLVFGLINTKGVACPQRQEMS
jgi:hypothetical protein